MLCNVECLYWQGFSEHLRNTLKACVLLSEACAKDFYLILCYFDALRYIVFLSLLTERMFIAQHSGWVNFEPFQKEYKICIREDGALYKMCTGREITPIMTFMQWYGMSLCKANELSLVWDRLFLSHSLENFNLLWVARHETLKTCFDQHNILFLTVYVVPHSRTTSAINFF